MRSIKMVGLGLVAVLALAVSATAASAHEFEYTGTTKTNILAESMGTQVFTAGFGTVECTSIAAMAGKIESAKAVTQAVEILYSKCTSSDGVVKEPIAADYEFNANESVAVIKTISFELTSVPLFGKCTIEIPNSTANSALKTVTYSKPSGSNNLELTANVSGIEYKGGLCGSGTTGTYKGSSLAWGESGGNLLWK